MTKKNTPAPKAPAGAPTTPPATDGVVELFDALVSALRAPRRPRRSRWVVVVGGTPSWGGYVELGEAVDRGAKTNPVLGWEDDALRAGQSWVRALGGREYVAVYKRPRRGSKRTPVPVWYFDPRGLPESWR